MFLSVWGSIWGFPDPVFFLFFLLKGPGRESKRNKKQILFSDRQHFFLFFSFSCLSVWGVCLEVCGSSFFSVFFSFFQFFSVFSGFLSYPPFFLLQGPGEKKKHFFFADRNKFFCSSCLAGSGGGCSGFSFFSCFLLFFLFSCVFFCFFFFLLIFLPRGLGRKKKSKIYLYIYI